MIECSQLSFLVKQYPEKFFRVFISLCLILFSSFCTKASADVDLAELSIEELMNRKVVTASRTEQNLSDTAAAVFVITQNDIRRSGVNTIPEVLRLVPGIHVARINASQWAITSRGFNGRFANNLLVLMGSMMNRVGKKLDDFFVD